MMNLYSLLKRKRALDPFGIKNTLVDTLLVRGINFNELKPGSAMKPPKDFSGPDDSRVIIEDAQNYMFKCGLSLEDMKEGTFYSVLENGKNLDGQDITKEEGQRIINEINDKLKYRYYNKPPMKGKMTAEEIARLWKKVKEMDNEIEEEEVETDDDEPVMKRKRCEDQEEKSSGCVDKEEKKIAVKQK